MKRKRLLTAVAGSLLAAAIAGVAWASIPGPDNVYSACMLKSLGTIRLIDKSLPSTNLMSRCTDKEIEISWNQAGQPGPAGPQGAKGEPGAPGTNGTDGTDGKDGVGVTTASEPAGANCASGGVQLTAAGGVSYVCNGTPGPDGSDAASILTGRVDGALIFDADPFGPPPEITRYAEPSGSSEHVHVTNESMRTHLSPSATIVGRDLAVKALMSGSGDTATFTLRDDGVDTPLSCTITVSSPSSNVVQTCDSGTATATILPGSELSLEITVNGTTLIKPPILFAWRATTP
jgi:hypothetical protein